MQSRELVKLYYRIGEVSEIVGVQPHVLRYWETEFRSIRPQKSSKGQRVYSRRDVEKLLRVKDLLRNQGFTIAGARKRLSDAPDAAPTAVGQSAAPFAAATPLMSVPSLAVVPSGSAPAPVIARESDAAPSERAVSEQAASEHSHPEPRHPEQAASERSAKDMRKALLGLRQDLMRMLDQLSAQH
jgi:DNA-binding transcriptional MerR regulator